MLFQYQRSGVGLKQTCGVDRFLWLAICYRATDRVQLILFDGEIELKCMRFGQFVGELRSSVGLDYPIDG